MPTYSEDILRLAETTPIPIPGGAQTSEMNNRLCGDAISVAVEWNGPVIQQVFWKVEGCAILKASAAHMAKTLRGKSSAAALTITGQFMQSFEGETLYLKGPLAAVYDLPARYKCALLPWLACENLLRNQLR